MPCLFSVLAALLALCAQAVDLPANPAKPAGGMEGGAWVLEDWGNSGTTEKVMSNGKRLLSVVYTGGAKDKAAFKHLTHFAIARNGKIRVHVYAPEDNPPAVGIALSTTIAYRWHESKHREIKKGWNLVEFDADASDWKTEASGWQHKVSVESTNDVRAVDLVVYNKDRSGVLYFEGLSYDLDDTGKKIAEFIQDLQSDDSEKRDRAEKALVAIGRPALEALSQLRDGERPEVLLRVASAVKKIEGVKEDAPKDPKILEALEKQKEEQGFEESRRRAEYTLRGIETQRQRLLSLLKDAQLDVAKGRDELAKLKFAEPEKKKSFQETLAKMEEQVKELQALIKEVVEKK